MHNDLHLGNIWIETLADEKQLQLKCSDEVTFTCSTNKIVKIFDFDFGSISATTFNQGQVKPNTALDTNFCTSLGRCSSMKKGRDYLFVSWHIYNQQKLPITLRVFMDSQKDIKAFYNMTSPPLAFRGDPCTASNGSTVCEPVFKSELLPMQSIAALFLQSFTNELQRKPDVMKYCVPSCRMDKKRVREEEAPQGRLSKLDTPSALFARLNLSQ